MGMHFGSVETRNGLVRVICLKPARSVSRVRQVVTVDRLPFFTLR